jgi:di/tricarboxylate transporter
MLTSTGVAVYIANWLARYGRKGEVRMLLLLTIAVSVLGCFMTNTAVVAIFVPVVLSVAGKTSLNASRLLIPLAYAGIVSGMLTLIATTPNLLVSAELERAGHAPLGFFAITPIGGAVLGVFVVYMLLVGRCLLPGERVMPPKSATRGVRDLLAEFDLRGAARRLQVPSGSPLVGKSFANSQIGSQYGVRVIILEQPGRVGSTITPTPAPEHQIRAGDVLVVLGTLKATEHLALDHGLRPLPVTEIDRTRWLREAGIAKVLIHPESSLVGSTLRQIGLRSVHGVQVLGVRRKNAALGGFLDQRLESGDAMLVIASWKRIRQLQSDRRDFVVLALPAEIEQDATAWRHAPMALGILALMVALSGFGIVPVVAAVLICALLAVATRCLTMEQGYGAVHWNTVVLIAGMMSIAHAMTKTGAVDLLVGHLVAGLGNAGPHVMLSALFLLASGLSMVLSNTATAVLVAPIALRAAAEMEVSPYAFAVTVAIASSAGFVMPVSSPAVMLVMGPGKYRVIDFVKVGTPLLVLTWGVTAWLAPRLFPFGL